MLSNKEQSLFYSFKGRIIALPRALVARKNSARAIRSISDWKRKNVFYTDVTLR